MDGQSAITAPRSLYLQNKSDSITFRMWIKNDVIPDSIDSTLVEVSSGMVNPYGYTLNYSLTNCLKV